MLTHKTQKKRMKRMNGNGRKNFMNMRWGVDTALSKSKEVKNSKNSPGTNEEKSEFERASEKDKTEWRDCLCLQAIVPCCFSHKILWFIKYLKNFIQFTFRLNVFLYHSSSVLYVSLS